MERLTETYRNAETGEIVSKRLKNDTAFGLAQAVRKLWAFEEAEEKGLIIAMPCSEEEKIFVLIDRKIIPLTVKAVNPFGLPHMDIGFPKAWNIYAENECMELYKSFYDIGKTVFFTEEEAEQKLKELEEL